MNALMLVLALAVPQGQPTVITPQDAIGYDYATAHLTQYTVSRFEAQWDGGAWTNIAFPPVVALPDTLPGYSTYRVIPPFSSGTHSVSFRACNEGGCSPGTSPFAFAFLSDPVAPGNVRKIPR